MRRSETKHLWPACLVLACATLVQGQLADKKPAISAESAAKTAAEAARVLQNAQANGVAETARRAAGDPAVKRMEAIVGRVKETPSDKPSFAEQKRQEESQKRLQDAMTRVSPEGKKMLAQSTAAPALRAPDESSATSSAAKPSPLSTDSTGPKPQPLKATPLAVQEKQAPRTVIDAGSSFFDSRAGFGVFVDDVVLNHPEFHLTCDELEVYMNKEEPAPADGAATPPKSAQAPTAGELAADGAADATSKEGLAPSERKSSGNLKQAIAKGRRVLINKMSAKGEPQTGIGREAVYDGATGDVRLSGWPQIQEGTSLTVATEPSTYFIIKANGRFFAEGGRSQTRIIQENEKKAPPPPAAAAPPATPPAPVPDVKPQGGQQ